MKRWSSYMLIGSPIWLLFILCIPVTLIYLTKGFSIHFISEGIWQLFSFFYFIRPDGSGSFVDRVLFDSVLGSGLRIGYWLVLVIFIFMGILGLKRNSKPVTHMFWISFFSSLIMTLTVIFIITSAK